MWRQYQSAKWRLNNAIMQRWRLAYQQTAKALGGGGNQMASAAKAWLRNGWPYHPYLSWPAGVAQWPYWLWQWAYLAAGWRNNGGCRLCGVSINREMQNNNAALSWRHQRKQRRNNGAGALAGAKSASLARWRSRKSAGIRSNNKHGGVAGAKGASGSSGGGSGWRQRGGAKWRQQQRVNRGSASIRRNRSWQAAAEIVAYTGYLANGSVMANVAKTGGMTIGAGWLLG